MTETKLVCLPVFTGGKSLTPQAKCSFMEVVGDETQATPKQKPRRICAR
jgi:hypothetical protein